ncbi:MAG: TrkA family potassium uptake protein [Bacilli bacterium]|nr:TrkA family potassium uptake protein [Bacilli bacterium]
MAKKSFAVIGLGQFGRAVVDELLDNGMDVIAIDNNREAIEKVAKYLPTSFVADSTNEQALTELGIRDVDAVIVAFGDNKEASILTTVILREFGIEQIIVRVDDDYYVPIMKKLGATDVITPQKAAGAALANRLGNSDYKDFYRLDSKYSIISIIINPGFIPVTLRELNSKEVYGVSIVLIIRNNRSFVPGGNDSLLPDDTIYVVGTTKEIKSFREELNGNRKIKK